MSARQGHPITFDEIPWDAVDGDLISNIYDAGRTGVVVRGAFPEDLRAATVERLNGDLKWDFPNQGMRGGEIRVIGDAATPTFTALRGPSVERYGDNAAQHGGRANAVFGDPVVATRTVAERLSALFGGRPAAPPAFDDSVSWAPFNVRALDPGEQIYSHHDDHFGLAVYEKMDATLDRSTVLSWFVTLEAPESGGELVIYGLWGSDPNPPMLPTRFLDTAALEAGYHKHVCDLRAGDLIVFDAGRHVHRVTPVEGDRARLTFGGFLTVDPERSRLAFWG